MGLLFKIYNSIKHKYIIILCLIIITFSFSITIKGDGYLLTYGVEKDGVFTGYTFSDTIIEYSGTELKNFPKENALRGVFGLGDYAGSLDVFVFGEGNYAIFGWKNKKIINGDGVDIKIFENGFYLRGSDKSVMSLDLATVEFSKDGIHWMKYPIHYDTNYPPNSPKGKSGFVGLNPVYLNMDNNFVHPASDEAGGDAFDLSNIGLEKGDYIRYVKIKDASFTYPSGQIAGNGVDIDGICAFYWIEE